MATPYKYHLRPGYGSDELLLEFINLDASDSNFEKDFFVVIDRIHPEVHSVHDLWMNDEVVLDVQSDKGSFSFHKDIWDYVFIMADENQPCIISIDEILRNSNLFEKVDVDFEKYKQLKS